MASKRGGKGKGPGKWVTSPDYQAVVEVIVRARNAAGMTQRDLATALGKTPSFVAKIEQRERRVDLLELIAISRALGIKEVDMLKSILVQLPRRIDL